MKAKVITLILVLTTTTTTVSFANETQCASGMTTVTGVDMNFTSDPSDDIYFTTCEPAQVRPTYSPVQQSTGETIFVITPEPISTPVYVTPVVVETSTAILDTATALIDTATVLSDTSTATVSLESINSFESAFAYIRLLLNQIYAIFEKLGIKGYK